MHDAFVKMATKYNKIWHENHSMLNQPYICYWQNFCLSNEINIINRMEVYKLIVFLVFEQLRYFIIHSNFNFILIFIVIKKLFQ